MRLTVNLSYKQSGSLDFMSFKVLMLLSLVWIPQETAAKPVQILYGVFDIIPLIATDVPIGTNVY